MMPEKRDSNKYFIFDLDGVIVDSKSMYSEAIMNSMRNVGLKPSDEMIRRAITPDVEAWVESMKRQCGISVTREIIKQTREYANANGWKFVELCKDISVLLKLLESRKLKQSIVSNAPSIYTKKVLERFEISNLFESIISCPEMKIDKAEGMEMVLKLVDAHQSNTFYICDTGLDVAYASRAGIKSIVVFNNESWDYPFLENVQKQNPFMIVNSPLEIVKWLEN